MKKDPRIAITGFMISCVAVIVLPFIQGRQTGKPFDVPLVWMGLALVPTLVLNQAWPEV